MMAPRRTNRVCGYKKTHESCNDDQRFQSNTSQVQPSSYSSKRVKDQRFQSNISQSSSHSSQGDEESNVMEQESTNSSSKRKKIDINSDGESQFSHTKYDIYIKDYVRGPWTTWKEVDSTGREALWQYFKGLYQWPPSAESLVYTAWENSYKKRFSGIMQSAHEYSLQQTLDANVKASLQGDLSLLKQFNPKWIKKKDWVYMIDKVSNTSKWKYRSEYGKQNINKMEDGSVSKHCGGSISIPQHKARLDAYQKAMVDKFGDDPNCHPLWDTELWCDVSGGIKKGRISIWGSVSESHRLLVGSSVAQSTGTSPENMEVIYERVREEMREEMEAQRQQLDAQAAEIEARRQEMRVEMDAKIQEIEATRQDITAKQRHIDARYEEMQKMITTLQNRKGGN
ncbi:unnamed protein product [Lactuca saligna]|uniref:Transposase, Ptta/En/Spm, plant n=1 Tax=Lactuca saligna TaxID=75948 RepID=A0AA35VSH7_LACSI|nr:unnamed protein product [Lactuca saligna]